MAHEDLDEVTELAKLYKLQKSRVEVQLAQELKAGHLDKSTHRELELAMRLIAARAQVKKDLGVVNDPSGENHPHLQSMKSFSEETVKVFSRPDSRRRVVSIVERLKRNLMESAKIADAKAAEEAEAAECAEAVEEAKAAEEAEAGDQS